MHLRTLGKGSKGPFVAELQEKLNKAAGYDLYIYNGNFSSHLPPLEEDGKYGKATVARVREFQTSNPPLKVDGKIGPNTYRKLTGSAWLPIHNQKAAQAAPLPKTTTPEAEASGFKTIKHLYVHCPTLTDRKRPQVGSKHRRADCEHIIPSRKEVLSLHKVIRDYAMENEFRIGDLIFNTHGASAGTLSINGIVFRPGDSRMFWDAFRPCLAPNYPIWIYACAFATHKHVSTDADVWVIDADEIRKGVGTSQMGKIAKMTKRTVRAGFGMQFGDMSGFVTPWAEVTPSGRVTMQGANRPLSTGEAITQKDKIFWSQLSLIFTGQRGGPLVPML